MQIDPLNGTVTLPNGCSVASDLSQDDFRAGEMFSGDRGLSGSASWIHYQFSGGHLEGKELLASICFYDQMLVYMSMTVDLYPPGPRDWSNYSLDVEAATKEFHDHLVEQMLGKPTHSDLLSPGDLPGTQATLAQPHTWAFPWGRVISGHDSKGGGTFITMQYGDRLEEANNAFRALQSGGR